MPYLIFFPSTGAVRLFNEYNLAQATYPHNPIIPDWQGVLAQVKVANKARGRNEDEHTVHAWYEAMFEWIDATGHLTFVDGVEIKAPDGSLHKRPKYHDDDDAETVAKAFWKLANASAKAITKQPLPSSEKKRGRPTGYSIDLVQANVALDAIRSREVKVPEQVRAVIELLTNKEFDYYTADEMKRLCNSSEFYKKVRTEQDGWRIWRYYQPMLRELGVVK
jgi:hypothetical protein